MPPLRLTGFANLQCGCLVARYFQPVIRRHVEYIEEKGCRCTHRGHRRDEPLLARTPSARHLIPARAASA